MTLPVRDTQTSPVFATQHSSGGATALFSVCNTALLWWGHSTCLCSQHNTLLVGPQNLSLFATQHSFGRTKALLSVRNRTLLWSDYSSLLCSQHRTPLVGLQHSSLFGVLQCFFLCLLLIAIGRGQDGPTPLSYDNTTRWRDYCSNTGRILVLQWYV